MLSVIFRTTRSSIVVVGLLAGSASTANAETDKKETTKKTWAVDASHGTYSDSISIEVPAFRGITPELALAYGSTDGNSELGVGWSLGGVGIIERASPGKGAPKYDESDIFLLDGQELIACGPDSVSPSCTTGGTHSTKIESYKRIALSGIGSASRWMITTKDGVRQVFAPVFSLSGGADVFRWGLHEVIDTKDNVVTYHWGTDQLGCCWEHLDSITYSGTTIAFHYEARPDHELGAIGDGAMRTVHGRLKTIDVTVGGSRLRAYKLGYTTSDATSRSLLSSVQQFGTDAELDGSGTVTSGTRLPAISIAYQSATPAFAGGDQDLSLNNDSESSKALAIDIDGDGKTDMLELYPLLTSMRRRTWISNGVGFDETSDEPGMSTSKDARFLPMDLTQTSLSFEACSSRRSSAPSRAAWTSCSSAPRRANCRSGTTRSALGRSATSSSPLARVACRPTPALHGRHPEGPAGYLRRGFVFSASRGSPTDRLDTRYEPHQPILHLSEKTDRARLPSRTAGGWRDFMDLDRPTGRGTDG